MSNSSTSFFGGLLQGVSSGLLENERKKDELKLRDTETRKQVLEMAIQSGDLTPDQQAMAYKALLAPTLQSPSILAKFMGGGKEQGGKKGKQQEPQVDPRSVVNSLFDSVISAQAGGASQKQPPSSTGDIPQPRTMNEIRAERESAAKLNEYRAKSQINREEISQEFQDRKKRAKEIFPEGTPEYANAVWGTNIESNKPESLDQAAAELYNQYRKDGDKKKFEEGVEALNEITKAKQKPSAPKQLWSVDPTSSSGYRVDYIDPVTEKVISSFKDRLAPPGYYPTEHNQILAVPDPDDPGKTVYQSVPITSAKRIPGAGGGTPKTKTAAPAKSTAKADGSPTGAVPEVKSTLPGKTIGSTISKDTQKSIQKAYTTWQDVKSRVSLMEKLKDRSAKDPTGASDMLLLGEHIALIWGYTKGTRMTRQMIEQHVAARPWDQKLQVAWESVKSGKVLSPEQRESFVEAAKLREQSMKEQYDAAKRGGSADETPSGPPPGATHIGTGPDNKEHYADAQGNDLGLVNK